MYRKIAAVGATAVAIVGVGTAALAASGPSTSGTGKSSSSSSSTSSTKHHGKKGKRGERALLGRGLHGQLTTKGKGGFITHSAIRGTVTSVSATAITVKAADGYSETFTLTKSTKVRERPASGKGKGTAGTLSNLKSNDKVAVLGKAPDKSTANPTATAVIDGLKK